MDLKSFKGFVLMRGDNSSELIGKPYWIPLNGRPGMNKSADSQSLEGTYSTTENTEQEELHEREYCSFEGISGFPVMYMDFKDGKKRIRISASMQIDVD